MAARKIPKQSSALKPRSRTVAATPAKRPSRSPGRSAVSVARPAPPAKAPERSFPGRAVATALGVEPEPARDAGFGRALGGAGVAWFVGADADGLRLAFYAASVGAGRRALLISPSPAGLRRDQERLERAKVKSAFFSDREGGIDAAALRRVERGDVEVLLVLSSVLGRDDVARAIARTGFAAVAIEQAELVAANANELRPSYARVPELLRGLAGASVCLLARPCRAEVRRRALKELGVESALEIAAPSVRDGVVVDAWPVRGERRSFALVKLLAELSAPGVVLCAAPHEVDAAFAVLSAAGVPCCRSHAGMPAPERAAALARFQAGDQAPLVLLTTSAVGPDSGLAGVGEAEDSEPRLGFGRAPTRSDLNFLVHYHAPASFEQYARELAWLGGSKGARAVTLYDSASRSLNDAIFEQQRLLGRHVREFARLHAEAVAGARQPTLEWLALQSGFSRRTSERIVALLIDAGAVRRAGKLVEARGSADELTQICDALGARLDALRAADRARLGAVERWAEGRECRARSFAQYFGSDLKACGFCAGCVALPGGLRQEPRRSGAVQS